MSDALDQASAWITRLSSGDVAENDIHEFALWLAQSHTHKEAYDEILDLWQDLGVVKQLPFEIPPTQASEKIKKKKSRWPAFCALAASLALAIVIFPLSKNTAEPQFYSTETGQQKTIYLDDSTAITLNTQTRLEVFLTKKQRNIKLHSGEAFFNVAKDSQRPFIVNTCFNKVQAIGTAFNIRCDRKKGTVTVTEGIVQVSHELPTSTKPVLLKKGLSIDIDKSLKRSKPQAFDSERTLGWRQGQLIFEDTPLNEVINDVNRYSKHRIYLASPQLAQLRVTGRFELNDTQTLLSALKHSLSLESKTQKDKSITLYKKAH